MELALSSQALEPSITVPNTPKSIQSPASSIIRSIKRRSKKMEPVVDTSTAVYGLAGTKRAASPALPFVSSSTPELHQPLPQHGYPHHAGQVCSCKRQRISHQHLPMETQNTGSAFARSPPSVIWYDFRGRVSENAGAACEPDCLEASNPGGAISNMETRTVTPFTGTQDSNLGSALTAGHQARQEQPPVCLPPQNDETDSSPEWRNEVIEGRAATNGEIASLQQRKLRYCSKGLPDENSKIHNFYTKASIFTPKGIVDFQRVQVDERSSFNLLPWSIAIDLDLILYSDRVLRTTVANRPVQSNQYCRFNIRVAGVEKTINTGVIPGLYTILLGREWIRSVNLLSDFGNRSYYIPVPLAVEAAEEKSFDTVDIKADVKDIELDELAVTDTVGEDYDDDEYDDVECDNNIASDDGLSLDGNLPSNGDLSSSELSLDGERSLDDDASSDDVLSLDDNDSSGSGLSLDDDDDDPSSGVGAIFEGDELTTDESEEDYESEEGEEGEDDTDADLQDFVEQHELLSSLKGPSDRDICPEDESIGEPAFNLAESAGQQSEPKEERVFSSSHHADNQEHSTATSPTKTQANRVRTLVTKLQAKEITKTLNHISRTPAGQSFKAPVKQLWPEYADTYAAKVPNPIDLGTIEMKVKNDIYPSIDEFRADIILLYQNSVDFNGTDHIITSAALEVRDTILEAISDVQGGKDSTPLRVSARGL